MEFVASRVAAKKLDIHPNSLRKLANTGRIEHIVTPSGQRRYNIDSFISKRLQTEVDDRKKICYCRVSSSKQKPDLKRQIQYLSKKFPDHEIISDVGSSLNYKRPGFNSLLEQVHKNKISEVVVAYKDRLARFGFDFISRVFELHKTKIVVLNKREVSQEQELTEDLIRIITIYTARYYGRRKYKSKASQNQEENFKEAKIKEETVKSESEGGSESTNQNSKSSNLPKSRPEEDFKEMVRRLKIHLQSNSTQNQTNGKEKRENSSRNSDVEVDISEK